MLKIVGTALAAAALMAGLAHADSRDTIRKDVVVSYSDLDLSTPTGAQALAQRIEAAATLACDSSPMFYSDYAVAPSLARREFNTCRSNAITTALKSLPHPLMQQIAAEGSTPLTVAASR